MKTMHHAGYDALIEYDETARIYHGEVMHLRDVITFQGHSLAALARAMADSVEDYCAFCRSRGEEPERASG